MHLKISKWRECSVCSTKIKFIQFVNDSNTEVDKYQIIHVGVGFHEYFRHTNLRFCGITYKDDTFYIFWDSPHDYYSDGFTWDDESFIVYQHTIYTDLKQLALKLVNDANERDIDEALG